MYKNYTALRCGIPSCVKPKLWRVMKLSFFICFVTCLQLSAASFAQKINLDKKNTPLREILNEIRRQSGYSILCDADILNTAKPVTVNVKNSSVEETLTKCFADQPFNYIIKEKTILVTPKPVADRVITASIDITGTVTDEKNLPLPGVTVKLAESQLAVSTNNNGSYKIKVPDEKAILLFSYIGYESQTIAVGDKKVINVQLKEQNSKLNEIVVVGYGSVKRTDLTGAVGSVNIADFAKAPVRSFEEALAGRVAGVQVSSQDGQPGSAINIIIRGANSLTQDNSPLYVIDGFPIENPENNAINPADIASIDILKDASATAIYGARGANGVVVITTKRGKSGKIQTAYSGNYALNQITKRMAVLSPYEFVRLQADINQAKADTTYLKNHTLDYYKGVSGINFQDKIFATRPTINQNISLSGGTETTRFSISGNIMNQDGIIINTGYDRYQGRFTLDHKFNDKFKIGLNFAYASLLQKGNSPSVNGVTSQTYLLYSVLGYRPVGYNGEEQAIEDNLFDPAISTTNDLRSNPYVTLQNEVRNNNTENVFTNGFLSYNIFPSLVLKISGGFTKNSLTAEAFNNSQTRSGASILGPNGSFRNDKTLDWLNENTLTYSQTFHRDHHLELLGGTTLSGRSFSSYGATVIGVPNESLGLAGLDEGTPTSVTAVASKSYLLSYYSRLNYSYRSRYLLTATIRADGSSKFSRANRWGYFPSFAAAWRLNEESWLMPLKSLSNLKLRASYGVTGNNRVTDFAYYSSLGFPIGASYSFQNATPSKGTYVTSLSNQDLKWESTKEIDGGLDIGFFNERLALTVDYYHKNTSNLLLNAQLPPTTGFSNAYKNIGEVQNNGWEFTLNTVNISTPDFSWSSSFNIAFNRNKVLSLTQNQEFMLTGVTWDQNYNNIPLYKAVIGGPIAQFYGLRFNGLYQVSDFDVTTNANGTVSYTLKAGIAGNGNSRAAIKPGDNKYVDLNGDQTINANDYTIIGNPNPKFIGGLNNTFTYKGFDLGVFLQFNYGNDIYNANRLIFETPLKTLNSNMNYFAVVADRWTPANPNTDISTLDGQGITSYNDRFVEDGSYLRLKTVQLGYTFPKKITDHLGIKALKIYVSGQNLYTWTHYSGFDPEVSIRNTALTPGFDYSSYPRPRTFTFGTNVTF